MSGLLGGRARYRRGHRLSTSARHASPRRRLGRPLPLHAAKLDEGGDALPQVVAVTEWRKAPWVIRGQRTDLGVGARLVEEGDREALLRATDHAMLGGADAPAAPALEHLAEVHRQRALLGRDVEPGALPGARLQPRHTVLREQRQKPGIGMRRARQVAPLALMLDPYGGVGARELGRAARGIADQPQRREAL